MYNLNALNPFSREAVACTVAFQRMGFELSQVGAGVTDIGEGFVTLHHGGEQYNVVLGNLIDVAPDIYVGRWREAIRAVEDGAVNQVELAELCYRSGVWGKLEQIAMDLIRRGFLREGQQHVN